MDNHAHLVGSASTDQRQHGFFGDIVFASNSGSNPTKYANILYNLYTVAAPIGLEGYCYTLKRL